MIEDKILKKKKFSPKSTLKFIVNTLNKKDAPYSKSCLFVKIDNNLISCENGIF